MNNLSSMFRFITVLALLAACDSGDTKTTSDASTIDASGDASTRNDASAEDASLPDDSGTGDAGKIPDGPIYVSADIDGTKHEAVAGFEAVPTGDKLQFTGWVGGAPGTDTWQLQVPNEEGTVACTGANGDPLVQFTDVDGSPFTIYDTQRDTSKCSVTTTQAAAAKGDYIEGTFTATVAKLSDSAMTKKITNGVFRVRRAN
ncbi:MAG: hypothetical protein KC416_00050 [Myxococcales bacterium]|nr:hypothetical protein [Myxococcales bacterium]